MVRKVAVSLFASFALLGSPRSAAADVAPIDACFAEGESCDNAGDEGNLSGTCQPSTCSRPLPPAEAGAGGDTVIYECLRCESGSGGSPATGGSGGRATGGSAGTGGTAGHVSGGGSGQAGGGNSGCSCRTGGLRADHSIAGLMLLTGLLALRWRRGRADPTRSR